MENKVTASAEKFAALIEAQLARVERMKAQKEFVDYNKLDKIIIGVCGGDGICPIITGEAQRVLEFLLKEEVEAGKVEFKMIDGLTIENSVADNKAIPDDLLAEIKSCHVI
ncbi:MAG: isocitrate/isopropylmalate dehydrogenase family protein, partial [Oscillospiraceae bacterium]|nr:isocitrate/isopropylmalate dehydrogenase family protein [Oscillospiraceae bacterium]